MSGLAVLFQHDGRPVDADLLSTMLDAIPYRGPDGTRVHVNRHVGLGHALNAVTPEDQGVHQPIVSPRTGCAIVADVRLDNRAELLAALGNRNPSDASDAELILHGYEAWGEAVVDRLLGDFVFVVWDPRAERLVCARDSSGQRVLFYRDDGATFAASSEIHQLFQDPSVPITPNEQRIRSFLVPINMIRNQKDERETFFTGIFTLEAGQLLIVSREGLAHRRYWSLKPPAELRYRRDEEYAEHFLELFSDVVRARLRLAHPAGILLSGGLDSSSVACVAQELFRQGKAHDHGFTSYSFMFGGLECDEANLIRDVQAKYGFAARFIEPLEDSASATLEPSSFLERPGAHLRQAVPSLLDAAARDGVRVMFTGGVADACIYGTRIVFDMLLRQGKLRGFMRHLRAFRRVADEPLRTTLVQAIVAPLAPLQVQRWFMTAYVRRGLTRYGNDIVPPWIREPLRSDLARQNLEILVQAEQGRLFASPARNGEASLLYPPEATGSLAPAPIELSQPFADRRLHEFLLAIPPDQKFEPHPDTDEFYAGSKWLVRRALRGILPESVRTRTTKTVFTSWLNSQIDQQWLEYERMFGPNAQSEIASRGYVDQAAFYSRLERIRRGDEISDLTWIMQLVGLELWLRALALPRADLVTVRREAAPASSARSPQSPPGRDQLVANRTTASAPSWHAAP